MTIPEVTMERESFVKAVRAEISTICERPEDQLDVFRSLPEDGTGLAAVFDADGTLYVDDCADDFTNYAMESGLIDGKEWKKYYELYPKDHCAACAFLLTFFKGLPHERLRDAIYNWWGAHAKRKWIAEVIAPLQDLSRRGYSIAVVTASPTLIIEPLLSILPISTVLGFDFEVDENGIITGEVDGIKCCAGGKAEKVLEWKNKSSLDSIAFAAGNALLDMEMMNLGTAVLSVYPDDQFLAISERKQWAILKRPPDFVAESKLCQ